MKKLLAFILWLPVCAFAQVPPPAPASVQDVIDGTATYKFISPAVAAAAGLTGGGGTYVSNQLELSFTVDVWVTNNSSTIWDVSSSVTLSPGGGNAIMQWEVDTNLNGTADWDNMRSAVNGGTTVNHVQMGSLVLPGWAFRYFNNSVGGSAAPETGTGSIYYYSTNSSGGGSGDVTAAGLAAGDYPIEADALTGTASINTTGNAAGATLSERAKFVYNVELSTNTSPASPLWVSRMPVPPRFTGTWNDFNGYAIGVSTNWANTTNVNEDYMITKADWNSTNGYRDAGWRLEILEEGVFSGLEANGRFIVDSNKFPNGLRYLTDYYHSKGLKLGIYTALGPNFGNLTCELGVATSYTNLDRHVDQFVNEWGFDFIFIDECGGTSQTSILSNAPTTTENMLLQRGRLVEAAIQKAGGNIGWLHVTRPTTDVRLDPMTLNGQNISIMGPINPTANWDFIEGQGPAAIVSRSYSNSIGNWKYTMPGHYWYQGQINDLGTMTAAERKFAFFMQTMLCGAITINSDRDFVESRGDFAFDASLGIGVNPPSTWSDATRDALFTNLPLAAIHQDPAVIPARRISSNHLAELWWRPVGWNAARRELSDSHAVMLINLSTTNQTQVVAFTNFAPNSGTFLVTDCLANTNFYATNFFTKTVEQTNCYIFKLEPIPATSSSATASRTITYGFQSVEVQTGTKLALTGNAYSLPWFASEGIRFAANAVGQYLVPVPFDATNASIIFCVGTTNNAAANEWTNYVSLSAIRTGTSGSRTTLDPNSAATFTNLVIRVTTGTNLTWFTNNMSWPATNSGPKFFQIFHTAATNSTGNRHIIGPTMIRYDNIQ